MLMKVGTEVTTHETRQRWEDNINPLKTKHSCFMYEELVRTAQ
jgi:hypothetical protein